jgi:hypothetical protein
MEPGGDTVSNPDADPRDLAGMKLFGFVMRSKAWPLHVFWEALPDSEREGWCADAEWIGDGSKDSYKSRSDWEVCWRLDHHGHI